ncbi:hypothetical protein [Leifsonia naganoensis]|uniref:hypothetical protein n=1 Tax=Leifsonia naganoensis TaxID=150025 RepID=UPI0015CDBB7C
MNVATESLPDIEVPTPTRASERAEARSPDSTRALAFIEQLQRRWISGGMRKQLVEARGVVRTTAPMRVVQAEIESAGWTVGSITEAERGVFELAAWGLFARSESNRVARHALNQLEFALDAFAIDLLDVRTVREGDTPPPRWYLALGADATATDARRIHRAVQGRNASGSREAVEKSVSSILSSKGVADHAWTLLPATANAALSVSDSATKNPAWRALAALLLPGIASFVLAVLVSPAVASLSTMPAELRVALLVLAILAPLAGSLILRIQTSRQERKGGGPRGGMWVISAPIALGMLVLGVVAAITVGRKAAFLGSAVTLGVVLLTAFVLRPILLRLSLSTTRMAWGLAVTIPAAVVVLNLPSTLFMWTVGYPQLIGSVPIGTVVASGWPVLLGALGAIAVAAAALSSLRNGSGIRRRHPLLAAASIAALACFVTPIANAAFTANSLLRYRVSVGQGAFGVEPVCLKDPQHGDVNSYWLIGTASRTSYLTPRLGPPHVPKNPAQADASQAMIHVDDKDPCPQIP